MNNKISLNPSVVFMHCIKCLQEKPDDATPSDFAQVNVGLTSNADLVVWCVRHDEPIGMFQQGKIDAAFKEVVSEPCGCCGDSCQDHKETIN